MITVYGYSPSGNCHKLRMLLGHLGRAHRWIETDSAHGATRTPEYLAKNPNGKVPMIEIDDGRVMVESNAILTWLADGTKYFAGDAWQRAQTLAWMFFEQYSHEPHVAVARFIAGWTPLDSPRRAELPKLRERGDQALGVMEKHLASNEWFSATGYGIADIALFGYTHCAGDGGFDLARYPKIRAWLDRVRAQPGFVPMPAYAAENVALIERSRAVS
jgi:glutathione S-transferase